MPEAPAPADGWATGPAGGWSDADRVAALFAVDPAGLGGVVLRARAGPERDAWLAALAALLPAPARLHRLPLNVDDDRLLGGLDLAATLQRGQVVAQRGLLAEADGGVLLLAMAERLGADTAARIAAVLDTGERVAERDGLALRAPSRIGAVALDEGIGEEEAVAPRLAERFAFRLEIEPAAVRSQRRGGDAVPAAPGQRPGVEAVQAARALLPRVTLDDASIEALCATALALGIDSVRAPLLALRAARASAALAGRIAVDARDATLAARLVLAWRATCLPRPEEGEPAPEGEQPVDPVTERSSVSEVPPVPQQPAETTAPVAKDDGLPDRPPATAPPGDRSTGSSPESPSSDRATPPPSGHPATADGSIEDIVLQAALASIPRHLLDRLERLPRAAPPSPSTGRAGAAVAHPLRGRPCGVRRGEPRRGARLDLLQTLRAAAPWQKLRRQAAMAGAPTAAAATAAVSRAQASAHAPVPLAPSPPPRLLIRREDFHITRFQHRSETTTVFVVDASGSSALHRLAEAKGAVELLLADCYVRRDSVAVIAFRGRTAEVLLPPTRSLVRAKRSLAGLPGGGGTPLAAGLEAAGALVDAARRRGASPVVVLLTDGRANIALDGSPGRDRAADDALAAAGRLRAAGCSALLIDTSAQPQASARALATALGAAYLPLPHADASALSRAVRQASRAPSGSSRPSEPTGPSVASGSSSSSGSSAPPQRETRVPVPAAAR